MKAWCQGVSIIIIEHVDFLPCIKGLYYVDMKVGIPYTPAPSEEYSGSHLIRYSQLLQRE